MHMMEHIAFRPKMGISKLWMATYLHMPQQIVSKILSSLNECHTVLEHPGFPSNVVRTVEPEVKALG